MSGPISEWGPGVDAGAIIVQAAECIAEDGGTVFGVMLVKDSPPPAWWRRLLRLGPWHRFIPPNLRSDLRKP
jgi:hypothetical protein